MTGLVPTHPLDTVLPVPLAGTSAAAATRELFCVKCPDRIAEYMGKTRKALVDIHSKIKSQSAAMRAVNRRAAEKRGLPSRRTGIVRRAGN